MLTTNLGQFLKALIVFKIAPHQIRSVYATRPMVLAASAGIVGTVATYADLPPAGLATNGTWLIDNDETRSDQGSGYSTIDSGVTYTYVGRWPYDSRDIQYDPTGNVIVQSSNTLIQTATTSIDTYIGKLGFKTVKCAAISNTTIATGLNAGDTIDGVTLVNGDAVLLPYQSTASENGIYIVSDTPARATWYNSDTAIRQSYINVQQGTYSRGFIFKNTNTSAVTVDSTSLTYSITQADSLIFPVDGQGFTITAGTKTPYRMVPYNFTILGWRLRGSASDSFTCDVLYNASYSGSPSSITASATPAVSAAASNTSTTLTGWTTGLVQGGCITVAISGSPAAATWATLELYGLRNV